MLKEGVQRLRYIRLGRGLNPYFNGTCSKSYYVVYNGMLVPSNVLILILMEHAQRGGTCTTVTLVVFSLNPYFNGTCSKRKQDFIFASRHGVLILILMEHAQRDFYENTLLSSCFDVLILILMEHAQREHFL